MDVQHVRLSLGNTPVFFPFQPYDTQKEYMQDVIECLNNGKHALLESPTGTGKTLSLLCSVLGWLQNQCGQQKSLIYYTSRTHIQLSQAAKEMKKTAYARQPAVVLASRTHLCINEEVKNSGENLINRACRNAIVKNACSHYTNYEQKLESMNHESVHDIEDLYQFGKSHQCCPYYASKKLAEIKATIVFMPYNYLLDPSFSKNNPLRLNNSVLIIDEAHNIDSVLKDAVSGSFTESNLKTIELSCRNLPSKLSAAIDREMHGLSRFGYDPSNRNNQVVDEFSKKKSKPEKEAKPNPIELLAATLTTPRLNQVSECASKLIAEVKTYKEFEKTKPIDEVYNLMKNCGIWYGTSDIIIETLNSMSSFWSIAGVMDPAKVADYVVAITNLSNIVSLLFPDECKSVARQHKHSAKLSQCYSVHLEGIYKPSPVLEKGSMIDWQYHVWCLHPALGLKKVIESSSLNGPRSIIITSGTLQPLESYKRELELSFGIAKQYKHLIEKNQLRISILPQSPNSYPLTSHFEATKKIEYLSALGKTLLPLFKVLPFGTLVFFQSYTLMNRAVEFWGKRTTLWRDMTKVSRIFVETKNKQEFESNLNEFKRMLSSRDDNMVRSVFLGVCRGKLSEGINLEGNQCRTVLMTGLPFPNYGDARVKATRDFQEKKNHDSGGKLWYSQQMLRALNQTVGRVIRSKTDFGMLILCDPRFKQYRYSLSEWTRDFFPNSDMGFDQIGSDIKEFFRQHNIHITETVSEDIGAFELSPFTEASSKSSRSLKNKSNNDTHKNSHQLSAVPESPILTVREREEALIAAYTVDRDRFVQIQRDRGRRSDDLTEEPVPAKRCRTTQEMFNIICSQPEQFSQPHLVEETSKDHSQSLVCNQPNSMTIPAGSQSSLEGQLVVELTGRVSLSTSNQQGSSDTSLNPTSKTQQVNGGPKLRANPFAQKKRPTTVAEPSTTTPTPQEQSQVSTSVSEFSVVKDLTNDDRPITYKCYICEFNTERPYESNCDCTIKRIGCFSCLKVLHNKRCVRCGKIYKKKRFQPLMIKSAFFSHDKDVQSNLNKPK